MQETINTLRHDLANRRADAFARHLNTARIRAEITTINRACARKGRTLRLLRLRNQQLIEAATALRIAQREYTAYRNQPVGDSNVLEAKGTAVALAATALDIFLPPYTVADKAACNEMSRKVHVLGEG